jgi:hypothetical protein
VRQHANATRLGGGLGTAEAVFSRLYGASRRSGRQSQRAAGAVGLVAGSGDYLSGCTGRLGGLGGASWWLRLAAWRAARLAASRQHVMSAAGRDRLGAP